MRLKEDSTSWKSRSIMRRDFRHDPGLPQTEVPRHRKSKRGKKKHVHDWKQITIGVVTRKEHFQTLDGDWKWRKYNVPKRQRICQTCGLRKTDHWGRGYYW